ncbi:F-box/LRR-repeat protein At3g48880-like [Musa acuminata AAA Group]|uniref:F-box/LRR-repeat protein At3g48880-like n=1 Tax=Musa acuminata AAA Group TaxID=214697 RepID=UPI0008A0D010|nr:PREDICTED: F-box/LRR-repeat protein At3g48880-like [Musa acuminata subsp. malaccensis]
MAALHSSLWRMVDLQVLQSNFVRVDTGLRLPQALRTVVACGRANVRCIIFHPSLHMNDEQLNLIARGCPRLKRLVLPCMERISKAAICNAIKNWRGLKSITVPDMASPLHTIQTINRSCKRLTELKVMGSLHGEFASAISMYLRLKVLSLRCCTVSAASLMLICMCMKHLEVCNLSHSLVYLNEGWEAMPLKKWMDNIVGELLVEQVEQNSSLRSFIYCQDYESCSACRRMMSGETRLQKEWRRDEVNSFDLDEDDGDVDAIVTRDDRKKVR